MNSHAQSRTEADDAAPAPAAVSDPAHVLEAVVEPVVRTMGYALWHLEWGAQGNRRTLRVFIDRKGGVSLDDCARINRILSNALDAAEAAPGSDAVARVLASAYVLEVSSPGLERPLARRGQFAQFVGHRATVRTHEPLVEGDNQRTFHGRIEATEPGSTDPDDEHDGVVVLREDSGRLHRIGLPLIRRANLVYEANAASKPGRDSGSGE